MYRPEWDTGPVALHSFLCIPSNFLSILLFPLFVVVPTSWDQALTGL